MKIPDYYFYPPKNPQFFFPKKKFKEYNNYYTPFSVKSKMFWGLYKSSVLVRYFFRISEKEIPLPVDTIKKIIKLKGATYFYNLGTKGIEQKATVIAKNKKQQRFLKFGQKKRSKELIANEVKILFELENQSVLKTAKVFNSDVNENYAYALTELIAGEKVNSIKFNSGIFQLLLHLGKIELKEGSYKESFSHGDFCPWNMLLTKNKELVLIDWEMAGLKPLGYDLFTYLFQTNFLLNPTKPISTILKENKESIHDYFKIFQTENWKKYLIKFASIKVLDEKQKSSSLLLPKYQELLQYNK
ncbi:MAG: thiamine kinase-like enzyme [Flavobacteriaceae bacterium]|jgi:thiamine kinase-like enzyme